MERIYVIMELGRDDYIYIYLLTAEA
jgi:hypothetical protein